jgi:hypothetical protein
MGEWHLINPLNKELFRVRKVCKRLKGCQNILWTLYLLMGLSFLNFLPKKSLSPVFTALGNCVESSQIFIQVY